MKAFRNEVLRVEQNVARSRISREQGDDVIANFREFYGIPEKIVCGVCGKEHRADDCGQTFVETLSGFYCKTCVTTAGKQGEQQGMKA